MSMQKKQKLSEQNQEFIDNMSASGLMDLSNFVTYDEKEYLLLNIAKSNKKILANTHSKPQETLEFKMTKQKEPFSFEIPLELPEH